LATASNRLTTGYGSDDSVIVEFKDHIMYGWGRTVRGACSHV